MMTSKWNSILIWGGAILLLALATVVYQPAAAKTGSLLVWLNDKIYVMDIDTLTLERVGEADADDVLSVAPGCLGVTDTPCWVVAGNILYRVRHNTFNQTSGVGVSLPMDDDAHWINNGKFSWSPDGVWLAYSVWLPDQEQAELRLYNARTTKSRTVAVGVDALVAPAWSAECGDGLEATGCKLAWKLAWIDTGGDEFFPGLKAITLASAEEENWEIPTDPIFELCWSLTGELLYSQPKRYFRRAENHSPAYQIPAAGQLANLSPLADYVVYYQPFRLEDGCQANGATEDCSYLGVWLKKTSPPDDGVDQQPQLIYNVNIDDLQGGLSFVPVWSPRENAFIFFQDGRLIYYDVLQAEAAIWHKSLGDKLRSMPVFSPNEESVAFVDNRGLGHSEYRLLVINPRLQPVEHIIETATGFRVLAWLPN